jgi:hypothetical protein
MFKFKKAITPVIGVSLLLVVSVLAVVGFQGWFSTFSSNLFVEVEQDSSENSKGEVIQDLIGDVLYVNSPSDNFTIQNIELGGVNCNISETLTKKGINKIQVTSCLSKIETITPDIVLITNDKIETKSIYYDEDVSKFSIDCELDDTEVLNGTSYTFYDSVGAFGCSSESRTCNDKVLSGNSSYMYSSCVDYTPGYDLIFSCIDLQNINLDLNASYQLADNIDCSATSTWNSGFGFLPIGTCGGNNCLNVGDGADVGFIGNFKGNGFSISDLFINRPSENNVGIFKLIINSIITNLNLIDIDITGQNSVAGIAANGNNVNISKISMSGVVNGQSQVGGILASYLFEGEG